MQYQVIQRSDCEWLINLGLAKTIHGIIHVNYVAFLAVSSNIYYIYWVVKF